MKRNPFFKSVPIIGFLVAGFLSQAFLISTPKSMLQGQDATGYWQLIDIDVKEVNDSITECREEGGFISKKYKNNASYHAENECNDPKKVEGWPLLWESYVEWRTPPEQFAPGDKVALGGYVALLTNNSSEGPQDYIDIKLSGGDGQTIQTIVNIPLSVISKDGASKEGEFIAPALIELPKSAGDRIMIVVTTRAGHVSYIYDWVQGELKEEETTDEGEEETEESNGETSASGTAEPTKSSRPRPTATLPAGCEDSGTRFSDLSGKVDVAPFFDPEDFDSAELGMVLCVEDRVRTGRKSSAILSMGDLTTYVMRPETTVILGAPLQHDGKIKVVAGNIWINIKKTLKDGSMEVLMNEAVLGIKGTTFIAEETGSESRLKVIEGVVNYTAIADGESIDIGAGETVAATADGLGAVEDFDIAAEQAEWQEYLDRDSSNKGGILSSDLLSGPVLAMVGIGVVTCLGIGGLLAVVLIIARNRRKPESPQPATVHPTSGAIFCIHCGHSNKIDAAFCRNCGKKTN